MTTTKLGTRWMIRRDMDHVFAIEQASFEFPWTLRDFNRCLRQRNCNAIVVDEIVSQRPLAYAIYELHRSRLDLLNFAVHPDRRREGIGKLLMDKLIGKLSAQRRTRLTMVVRETNLPAQLFLRSMGFMASALLPEFYDETDEAAIYFAYDFEGENDG